MLEGGVRKRGTIILPLRKEWSGSESNMVTMATSIPMEKLSYLLKCFPGDF